MGLRIVFGLIVSLIVGFPTPAFSHVTDGVWSFELGDKQYLGVRITPSSVVHYNNDVINVERAAMAQYLAAQAMDFVFDEYNRRYPDRYEFYRLMKQRLLDQITKTAQVIDERTSMVIVFEKGKGHLFGEAVGVLKASWRSPEQPRLPSEEFLDTDLDLKSLVAQHQPQTATEEFEDTGPTAVRELGSFVVKRGLEQNVVPILIALSTSFPIFGEAHLPQAGQQWIPRQFVLFTWDGPMVSYYERLGFTRIQTLEGQYAIMHASRESVQNETLPHFEGRRDFQKFKDSVVSRLREVHTVGLERNVEGTHGHCFHLALKSRPVMDAFVSSLHRRLGPFFFPPGRPF